MKDQAPNLRRFLREIRTIAWDMDGPEAEILITLASRALAGAPFVIIDRLVEAEGQRKAQQVRKLATKDLKEAALKRNATVEFKIEVGAEPEEGVEFEVVVE